MESEKCHLGAIIVRDLSVTVSNYRSTQTLDEYCKAQGVLGIADVDTRALTKALRDTGCLVGVITTDASKTDAELVAMAKVRSLCIATCTMRRVDVVRHAGLHRNSGYVDSMDSR
jgi:carbamoyl-phosphate synthase small subunit